jgi:UDP-glucose 4-epimerase
MKIAVIGGCGFIGSHVCDVLIERGFDVRTIGRCTHGNNEHLEHVRGDITHMKSIEKAIEGCDAIMHYAALINVDESMQKPREYFITNVFGTFNVLEVARMEQLPVVYKSTCEIFGNVPAPELADENFRPMPRGPYAASKLCAERYCLAYHFAYDLPIAISRGFNTYGPRQSAGQYGAVIPKFISRVLSNQPPIIFGDGLQTRDYVYVKDIAKADVLILESLIDNKISGEVFNVCTSIERSIKEIAYKTIDLCGKKNEIEPIYIQSRPGEVRRNVGTFEKIKKILGWQPETTFDQGLMEAIEWFKERQLHEREKSKPLVPPTV